MRQTGRYLPEYRELREQHSLDALCRSPQLAAEVTLQPLARFDVDAALLFTDVVLPLEALGIPLSRDEQDVLAPASPLRSSADIAALRAFDPRADLRFVQDTIGLVREELAGHRPLIGLAAGPFSLACYALEGHAPRAFTQVRALMYGDPPLWDQLCTTLAQVVGDCLIAQVEAGVDAVQVFDSWVGTLSPDDYARYVLPHSRSVFDRLRDANVPAVHFGLGTGHLLEVMTQAGGDVLGIDCRTPLDEAWARIGPDRAVQGNLNPTLMLAPIEELLGAIEDVLERAAGRAGHIFNLGHGLLPSTPTERVDLLVRHVHARTGPGGDHHR